MWRCMGGRRTSGNDIRSCEQTTCKDLWRNEVYGVTGVDRDSSTWKACRESMAKSSRGERWFEDRFNFERSWELNDHERRICGTTEALVVGSLLKRNLLCAEHPVVVVYAHRSPFPKSNRLSLHRRMSIKKSSGI